MDTLGLRLKTLRKERFLTLEMVSKDFNTTAITISRYENGIRTPKSDVLNQFADYYNVSVDYLLGRTENKDIYCNYSSNTSTKLYVSESSTTYDADYKIKDNTDILKVFQDLIIDFKKGTNITFNGSPMSHDDLSSFLESLDVVLEIAKRKTNAHNK